ncbi:MAG: LpqB family beta-propeller domain-containing protein [Blastocatellia bacterium]|nr:LpqB family beta-propeller domain-containing protein [Blastocatellia bacterium]
MRMRIFLSFLLFSFLILFFTDKSARAVQVEGRASFSEPALSPDRKEIAFVSGGDIWTVGAEGGDARLLVSHPANESRPLYSPDGKRLAFISARTGGGDIYLLTLETGELQRLTFDDANDQLDGWSRDGRWIYFTSSSRDIAGMNDLYRVASAGGTPMQVSADRYASEYWAAPSPDGEAVAFTARGLTASQWWRNGRSHIDQCEIWLLSGKGYERVTDGGVKEMWPMWSADGRQLYFVSDRGNTQNLWVKPLGGAAKQITKFKDGRVLWPNISYDGKQIVFERDFRIWRLDTGSGNAAEVAITRRGASAGPAVERMSVGGQVSELALSPDGKKVAVVARGEVFAASAKDGGDAARVTRTPAAESQIVWAPDSRRLAYVSDREGAFNIYLYDFGANAETALTRSVGSNFSPSFSPDGKTLTFIRDGGELRAIDLATREERTLASADFDRPPLANARSAVWSGDSKWVAFFATGERAFTNVHVLPAAGGESRPVSFLANSFAGALTWSPDGRFILFTTSQRTEDGQLARVDLTPRTPRFREDQFRDLFKEQNPPAPPAAPPTPSAQPIEKPKDAKAPVEIVFEGIRERLSFLPTGLSVSSQTISPDGKQLLILAQAEGQFNLYTWSLDELAREPAVARQLTSTPGFKNGAQFTPDSKEVYYLENGRINITNIDTRATRPLAINAEMDVDFAKEKMEVFHQAWSYLRDHFYDENFHGVNWNTVRATYERQAAGARTPDELRRVINLMVGELNASHLGISGAPAAATTLPVGRLGLRFDRVEYETNGRLRVTEVIELGPAAIAGTIKIGDYLHAVDGVELSTGANLDEQLAGKVGRRVELKLSASADGTDAKVVAVKPASLGTEKGLLYRQWVRERRAYVEKISGGRLGYVHMPDMSGQSLSQLYADLDAQNHARDGVVVDIRNNNGGFVNAYAIDVFARRGYMTMTIRGKRSAPARSALGQRALERPTILVVNQHSLSDAEDFTEGYRALKLGKVVGEPTAGWIIYTWGTSLIDGSAFRLPRQKVQDSTGQVMELNPRPVDLRVQRPIGESYTGVDSQLDAAVRELLKQLDGK